MPNHNCCGLCKVDIKNLNVKSGNDILLKNINLEFHCGQLTALIGRNGAGKTTLLKALLGERHYEGTIAYERYTGGAATKLVIGYVPQQLSFDKSTPISVLDFMMTGGMKRPVWLKVNQSARQAAKKRLEEMDCGQLLDRNLGDLSGGELQRVLLSMAIDPIPDLLILDEPVSGVDLSGLDLFYKTVTSLRDHYHMAIILVSHDLGLIKKYADKVVLLDKTVIAQGEAEQVFQTEQFKMSFGLF